MRHFSHVRFAVNTPQAQRVNPSDQPLRVPYQFSLYIYSELQQYVTFNHPARLVTMNHSTVSINLQSTPSMASGKAIPSVVHWIIICLATSMNVEDIAMYTN